MLTETAVDLIRHDRSLLLTRTGSQNT